MADALESADDYIKFKGKNGKEFKISEAHKDIEAYEKLNDSVSFWCLTDFECFFHN